MTFCTGDSGEGIDAKITAVPLRLKAELDLLAVEGRDTLGCEESLFRFGWEHTDSCVDGSEEQLRTK